LDFRERGDFASVGSIDVGSSDLTIAAWVRPRSNRSGQDRIVSKERIGVALNQFRLYLHDGNRLGFAMTGLGGSVPYPFVTSPESVPLNRWTHVAVTRRGKEFRLYIDGREAARTTSEGSLAHGNRLDLRLGSCYAAQGNAGDYSLNGMLDDVRIYARALSPQELADPQSLPGPGWIRAARWTADAFEQAGTRDFDVTAAVARPGQYEVAFRPDAGTSVEIQKVELLIAGRPIPNRVSRLGEGTTFRLYRMEQTTADTPTGLRVSVRIAAKASPGIIELRPLP
jgi:hypothetical protein